MSLASKAMEFTVQVVRCGSMRKCWATPVFGAQVTGFGQALLASARRMNMQCFNLVKWQGTLIRLW